MEIVAENLTCERGGQTSAFPESRFGSAPETALKSSGPNGSGKSTLIRALAGLGRDCAGHSASSATDRISYLGASERTEAAAHRRRKLGFLDAPFKFRGHRPREGRIRIESACRDGGSRSFGRPSAPSRAGDSHVFWDGRSGFWTSHSRRWTKGGRDIATSLIAENCRAGGISVVTGHQGMALPNSRWLDLSLLRGRPLRRGTDGTASAA